MIFAGGKGERLSYYTESIPKPMIELDGIPIIIRLMNYCSRFGVDEFIILGGYKCNYIKKYFWELANLEHDITLELSESKNKYLIDDRQRSSLLSKEVKKIRIIDCGVHDENCTAQDLLLAKNYIVDDEDFLILYGDTLADVNIQELKKFHKKNNSHLTISVNHLKEKNGTIEIGENSSIKSFLEKGIDYNKFVNIGFMLCDSSILHYIEHSKHKSLEPQTISGLINNKKNINAFFHNGYYQAFDTLKDIKNFDGRFL